MTLSKAVRFIVLTGAACALNACGLVGLRQQVESLESMGSITVEITPHPASDHPTYALAWRMEDGARKDSAGFQRVRADGIAAFSLKLDSVFRVGAFTDENGNGAFDAGEPLDFIKDARPVSLSEPSAAPRILKLALHRGHELPPGTVLQVPKGNKELGGQLNLALGEVASLDDKQFEPDAGGAGLWRPLNFLSDNRMGLYLTEPYAPDRTPVIFVYGIGGSPQDWRYFIENFDRSRHQLWFFHYPSGMRLPRVAGALALSLRAMKHRHGFSECHVVAHSMGGLVSRAAICQAVTDEGVNFIPKFVSISTPWGGHKAAESGIRHLKKPVPSWLDVRPGSDFLLSLYATPLPQGTTHDLIYGSIEKRSMWMKEDNDGVVTVASETDLRVQRSTSSFTHLKREHVEILNQQECLDLVEEILDR